MPASSWRSLVDFPPEILSEIFIDCLPWTSSPQIGLELLQNARPPTVFNPRNAPFLLMHVCRRWRFIAEATPALWTRLPMTHSTEAQEPYKIYVKNSGRAPLWAHLISGDAGREVADIITPHAHRWEYLTITFQVHSNDPASIRMPHLPNQLPSLKYLHIQGPHPSKSRVANFCRLPTFAAPLLRSVRVSSCNVLRLNLPWSQLTHYSGEFKSTESAQAFLSQCTNLEVLYLCNPKQSCHIIDFNETVSPIRLPRLHDLSLIEHDMLSYYHELVDCLFLPALKKACISTTYDHEILAALCRCVVRSSPGGVPRLRSVEIQCLQNYHILYPTHLQELSLVAPGIEELRVSQPSSQVLFAMKFHPTDSFLFPNLQHLALINPPLQDYQLIDVIMSRCRPPPSGLGSYIRLRHVEVMFTEGLALACVSTSHREMVQPRHEAFQDVAERFTDDPNFKWMCGELKSILTVRRIHPSSREYRLPRHWGNSMDPQLCFVAFSDAVFTFFENYNVHHPLLLSRHQAVPLLREFLRGNPGSDGLLRAHRPKFLDRASALLNKWQPVIDEYSEKERWVVEAEKSCEAEEYTHKVVYCTSS